MDADTSDAALFDEIRISMTDLDGRDAVSLERSCLEALGRDVGDNCTGFELLNAALEPAPTIVHPISPETYSPSLWSRISCDTMATRPYLHVLMESFIPY